MCGRFVRFWLLYVGRMQAVFLILLCLLTAVGRLGFLSEISDVEDLSTSSN